MGGAVVPSAVLSRAFGDNSNGRPWKRSSDTLAGSHVSQCSRSYSSTCSSRGEMWGDVGRCGEMWGDVGRCGENEDEIAAELAARRGVSEDAVVA